MPVLSDAKVRALKPKEKPCKQADFDGLFLLVMNRTGFAGGFNS